MPNSHFSSNITFEALVLSSICADQPIQPVDSSDWSHIKNLRLADPDFAQPGPVDMLLSADIFASSLLPGLRQGKPGQPRALNTIFGWIVMGACDVTPPTSNTSRGKNCLLVSNLSLDNSIKKFWELENVSSPIKSFVSKEDQQCEDYFVANHCRNEEGRFVVPLPFVDPTNKPNFVNSREIALKRFFSLERKLNSSPETKKAYVDFMEDYESSGHLEEVDPPSSSEGQFYYIPHHGVLRPDSVSTPLRVVFDASAKDAKAVSLNQTLLPGPKLQTSIFDVLLRFRWHAVVFTGDVRQMYRQILVPEEDAEYQRIVWRPSPVGPVRDYRLLTVTYGVSSAPFQALRTVAQLAKDSAEEYPAGAAVLARDIYVDDVVTGADSIEQACQLREELAKILSSGGFQLRKWTSNSSQFFDSLPSADLYSEDFKRFEEMSDLSLKILGLLWQPQSDSFRFRVADTNGCRCTKRTILSEIARIYDPLGFLGPVTFYAKYLMQLLWTAGVSWDDDAPSEIASEWQRFKSQLSSLASVSIPRRAFGPFASLQLHGFCDASERGYCAVIYCRVIDGEGSCSVNLCCAKTKVAPLRKQSIPRLELQAAVLLTDLIHATVEALKPFYSFDEIYAWSDSSVALSWIKSCPSKWKTFVANRVSHIQDIVAPDRWRHVSTHSNPADVGSRGSLPADLVVDGIWWQGPSWLAEPEEKWPTTPSLSFLNQEPFQEEQRIFSLVTLKEPNFIESLLNKFSSLSTLKHVVSYLFRFGHNSKQNSVEKRVFGPLLPSEIHRAFMFLIKFVQESVFSSEFESLKNGSLNSLPKSLRKLSPFIDEAGLLRVGGRLVNANVDFDVKHPLLLPRSHRLTSLIIQEYHTRFMHPGVQTLQNLLAQHFWILSSKRAVRSVLSGCVKCFRARPQPAPAPFMGDLPSYRVNQIKCICVFVCTSTKDLSLRCVRCL
ncbi:hypothetical protein ABMA27_011992 [Loxostege sticticalis]|uniref:Integrase zinc-binding domain-containing protein n=1 Tax=Loxostege sticticalis TaxID=481309 RepID=A0ABR3IIE3_LOXSC